MDIQWFKDLGSLANTGNFSQAAELNNISQSAFSRRIRALETWVGASLVDRSNHPVKLTAAGEQMLDAGTQALSRIETERNHIRETLAQPDRYVVAFAAQHSIGWRFYPSWLQALEKSFGPIISRLRADDLPNCIVDLKRGEVDFVICYESEHATGVESTKEFDSLVIGRDRLIPVCKTDSNSELLNRLDQRGRVSHRPISPIKSGPRPIVTAQGRIRGRMPIVLSLSAIGRSHLGNLDPPFNSNATYNLGLLGQSGRDRMRGRTAACSHERNTGVMTGIFRDLGKP